MKPKYIINEMPAKAQKEKGHARYPDDFPHLKDTGKDFIAWKEPGGDAWHIETSLSDDALFNELMALPVPDGTDHAAIPFVQTALDDGLAPNDLESLLMSAPKNVKVYPILVEANNTMALGFVPNELFDLADGPTVEDFTKAITARIDNSEYDGNGVFFVKNYLCMLNYSGV